MPKTFCALAFPRLKRLEIVPGKNGERGNLSLCAFSTSPPPLFYVINALFVFSILKLKAW